MLRLHALCPPSSFFTGTFPACANWDSTLPAFGATFSGSRRIVEQTDADNAALSGSASGAAPFRSYRCQPLPARERWLVAVTLVGNNRVWNIEQRFDGWEKKRDSTRDASHKSRCAWYSLLTCFVRVAHLCSAVRARAAGGRKQARTHLVNNRIK